MGNFSTLVRSIAKFFLLVTALVIIVFAGIITYNTQPSIFRGYTITSENWKPKNPDSIYASGFMHTDVKYGYRLISETSNYIGPQAEDSKMRFAGNNLACTNCHLKAGTQAGSGSWIGVVNRFPQFRGRSNQEGTIEDRINGCMERSMNGRKMPDDSREMQAIVTYMKWLSEDLPAEREKEFKGFPAIEIPGFAVDLKKGKELYARECAVCHGDNGAGQKLAGGPNTYLYPPLWGPDSFNDGAGMHRVLTAAQFIKSNMPFEQANWKDPKLTDEEAYHLAGYINSFSRPHKSGLEKDFPDRKLKPVSTPYGPWADNFSADQHKWGPFPPIIEFYEKNYNLQKTK